MKSDGDKKARTVGISMGQALEERAKTRAEALGLKFSTYVTQCVEAELRGFAQIMREDTLDLDKALRRAREYMEQKSVSIDFEADVEAVIAKSGLLYEKLGKIGGQRVDFAATLPAGGIIAVECRHNVRQQYALALGQGLLLRSHPDVAAVAIVVPYLEGFDETVLAQFAKHDISVATPDILERVLAALARKG
ncbi:MAG TPA: hypothetical protein PKI32_01470 [Opitutales bacterium]|nr:hypothetical protein [Opitutales bacterium]